MRIGIVCYPTFGGSGIVATELGKALADKGHEVHVIAYRQPVRLNDQVNNVVFHEVRLADYHLFEYPPYELSLACKLLDVVRFSPALLCLVFPSLPCIALPCFALRCIDLNAVLASHYIALHCLTLPCLV